MILRGKSLKNAEKYALSDEDIQNALNGVKIITYPELEHYDDINNIFDKNGRFVCLFLTENENSGHWTCCFKRENGKVISWFDSYGLKPDDRKNGDKSWLSVAILRIFNEKDNYLIRLLRKAFEKGYTIEYNPYKFQSYKGGNNECGRWVILRLLNQELSPDKFKDYIDNSKITPDNLATQITYNIIGK